jgi:hypothetical protein
MVSQYFYINFQINRTNTEILVKYIYKTYEVDITTSFHEP